MAFLCCTVQSPSIWLRGCGVVQGPTDFPRSTSAGCITVDMACLSSSLHNQACFSHGHCLKQIPRRAAMFVMVLEGFSRLGLYMGVQGAMFKV